MTQQEQNMLKAIQITKPYNALALVDGWLCIKYLEGGVESISTFADISKGDIILYGNATHSRPAAPETSDETISKLLSENARIGAELRRAQQEITKLNGEHDAAIRKAERERVLNALDIVIEKMTLLPNGKHSCIGSGDDLKRYLKERLCAASTGDDER